MIYYTGSKVVCNLLNKQLTKNYLRSNTPEIMVTPYSRRVNGVLVTKYCTLAEERLGKGLLSSNSLNKNDLADSRPLFSLQKTMTALENLYWHTSLH